MGGAATGWLPWEVGPSTQQRAQLIFSSKEVVTLVQGPSRGGPLFPGVIEHLYAMRPSPNQPGGLDWVVRHQNADGTQRPPGLDGQPQPALPCPDTSAEALEGAAIWLRRSRRK